MIRFKNEKKIKKLFYKYIQNLPNFQYLRVNVVIECIECLQLNKRFKY